MQVVHPSVDTPLDSPYHRDPVHVPLDDVAAQPVPRAQCTLQIHGAPHRVLAEQRTPLRRLHHVHRESTRQGPLDGETGAVHRDALALLQTLVGGLDREREPRFSFAVSRFPRRLRDSAHGTYDPGKHSRLSNTNNVGLWALIHYWYYIAAYPIPIMYQSPEPFAQPASSAAGPRGGAVALRERPERRPRRATLAPAPNRAGPPDRRRGGARPAPLPLRTRPTGSRRRATCGVRPATSWGGTRARRCSQAV